VPFDSTVRHFLSGVFALLLAVVAPLAVSADDAPGDFDFYVLSLSWSPTYCTIEGSPDDAQCGVERHGFIVHGLWPQYERGYPEYCRASMSTRVSNSTVRSIFDIMPSAGLIRFQWRKHGICAGLPQDAYFDLLRQAFDKISLPESFDNPEQDMRLEPGAIETAFLDANPDLSAGGIAVACKQQHLSDVRICLTKDLEFRDCREVDGGACRARRIEVPAVR